MAKPDKTITVGRLLRACYTAFFAAGMFSFAVNLLMLTMPIFMFQVFDRVLSSRSESTLFLLLLMAVVALAVQAALDAIRAFAFVRISGWIDRRIGPVLLSSLIADALDRGAQPNSNPLRALATLRTFLTGPGMLTMLDVPWVPVFIIIIFWVNPAMGITAVFGAVIMLILGLVNDRVTRTALAEAQQHSTRAYQAADSAVRNAAVVESMGMRRSILGRWRRENDMVLDLQSKASDRVAVFQAISKSMRMLIQMAIMSVAVLQIVDPDIVMTPGMMIASVLILGRALQPVEMGIGQARNLADAVEAYRTIETALATAQSRISRMELPPPTGQLAVENLGYQPKGTTRPILQRISFSLEAGEALGVIGPSAAGKSTLARLLVGVERPTVGSVRFDGADAFAWNPDELGRHIGFMPQESELFEGTVADNVARLSDSPDPDAIVAAAKLAGLHEQILRLPDGYDTQIGNAGAILSGGQRQRVALARALYGDPKVLVLDEPNSNLDASGDDALMSAIDTMKKRGITVILITHRPHAVSHMDKVLVLQNGMVQKFGPREEVLPTAPQPARHQGTPGRPDPLVAASLEQAFANPPQQPGGAGAPAQGAAQGGQPPQTRTPPPPPVPGQGQRLAPPPPPPPSGRRVATPYLGSGGAAPAMPPARPPVANTDLEPPRESIPRPPGMPGRFGGGRARHREPEAAPRQPVTPPTVVQAPPPVQPSAPQRVAPPPPPSPPQPRPVAASAQPVPPPPSAPAPDPVTQRPPRHPVPPPLMDEAAPRTRVLAPQVANAGGGALNVQSIDSISARPAGRDGRG